MRQRTLLRRVSDKIEGKGRGIAQRITYWQRKRGLCDDDLASRAGIAVPLLKQIKAGEQEPIKGLRRSIAKALRVTVAELLE